MMDELCMEGIFELNIKKVKFAIENGATKYKNNSSLYFAVQRKNFEIVKCLVENGADVNQHDDIAFRSAAKYGTYEIAHYLHEKGANVYNYKIVEGIRDTDLNQIKDAIKKGGNIDLDNGDLTIEALYSGNLKIFKFIFKRIKKHYCGNGHIEILPIAAGPRKSLIIVKILLKNNANIYGNDHKAIRESFIHRNIKISKYLLKYGANIYVDIRFCENKATTSKRLLSRKKGIKLLIK